MTPERHARISSLFIEAAELPAAERPAFLQAACDGDHTLRCAVEALLRRDGRPAAVDVPAGVTQVRAALASAADAAGYIPQQIGQYQIIDVLGQGGMGTVYRAQQAHPSRLVALKVVNPALLTPSLIRRFEFEAQVLAELHHPGIAQIYEAGTADMLGMQVPFFAMELVEGQPLTDYATEQHLDRRARLALLVRVCEAVHHAHQKGVIHRDLKPANILVSHGATEPRESHEATQPRSHEGWRGDNSDGPSPSVASWLRGFVASPKILDFGIARATSPELRHATLQTQPGQIIGTLPYMSPEQVAGVPGQVDTRTDVYALGVIAFELLTGHLPHDLSRSSLADAVRIISSAPPARLSQHDRSLRGDLETLVARATERDIARRYPSAAEFGREIERYLAGEALEARRDSGFYVLRKALVRHRRPVAVAAAFVLVLVVAAIVSVTFAVRAGQERQRAEEQATVSSNLAEREGRERQRAENNAAETRQVAQFQSKMLESINAEAMGRGVKTRFRDQIKAGLERQSVGEFPDRHKRSPEEVEGQLRAFDEMAATAQAADVARHVMDEFVLRRAADALEQQFADQPLVRAQLHLSIGDAYRALGLYADAEPHLNAALELRQAQLGPRHIDVAEAMEHLADALHYQQKHAAAEPLIRASLEISQEQFGDEHPRTAQALAELAALLANRGELVAAESMHREALATRRRIHGDRSPEVASQLGNYGEMLRMKGDYIGAEAAHREALAIRRATLTPPCLELAISENNLANLLTEADRYVEAAPIQRSALEQFRALLGDEHAHTVSALHNLANTLRATGDLDGAEPLFRESIARHRQIVGDDDPGLAFSLTALGMLLQARGDLDAAGQPLREALTLVEKFYPASHPFVGTATNNLAALHHARREYDDAEPLYRRALQIRIQSLGENHPDVAGTLNNLAAMLRDEGKFDTAEPLYRRAIAALRTNEAVRPQLAASLAGLGRVLLATEQYADAEPVFREALSVMKPMMPPDDERIIGTQARLGRALTMLTRFDEAEAELAAAHDALQKHPNPSPATTSLVTEALAALSAARRTTTQPARSHP